MYAIESSILVVDDMSSVRKLIIRALNELGFENFGEASDGAKAWEVLLGARNSYDLIIADWIMPNASGIDLLRRVRASQRFSDIPFFLVTSENDGAAVREAAKAGVTGYILKPFSPASIRAQLSRAWEKDAAV